jgi:hypothetical protein
VAPRPKTPKTPNLNSPSLILFAIQRKKAKFLQNSFVHLVTLFSVYLRVLPFSEVPPQKPNPQKTSQIRPKPRISAHSRRPIIKGLRPDLIFYRDPFIVTHILISSLIQNPFSHKFLKPF